MAAHRFRFARMCGAALASMAIVPACVGDPAPVGAPPDVPSGSDAGADAAGAVDASGTGSGTGTGDASADDAAAVPPTHDAGDSGEDACVATTTCVLSDLRTTSSCTDADVIAACDKGCAVDACNTACDAPVVVIDQLVASDHTVLAPWQSFQVAATGVLTELQARPNVYSADNSPSNLTLSVYVGEGTSGARIYQQLYTLASASGAPLHAFGVVPNVPLQAGQKYTWELTGAKDLYYGTGNPYVDGRTSAPDLDMVFKLSMAGCH